MCNVWWTQTQALDSMSMALPFPGVLPAPQLGRPHPGREQTQGRPPAVRTHLLSHGVTSLELPNCRSASRRQRLPPRFLEMAPSLPPPQYAQGGTHSQDWGGRGSHRSPAFYRRGKIKGQSGKDEFRAQRSLQQLWTALSLPTSSGLGTDSQTLSWGWA